MKIWGLTDSQARGAAKLAGVKIHEDWAGGGISHVGRALSFRIALDSDNRTADGEILWRRTSASGFHPDRKVAAVCWHGHYAFMAECFNLGATRIQTMMADYKSAADFDANAEETGYRNVGSMMYPMQAREVCLCQFVGNDHPNVYDRLTPEAKGADNG